MSPLSKYDSYEFIPYLSSSPLSDTSSMNSTIQNSPFESSFRVHNTSSWTYCGPLLAPDYPTLPISLQAWAKRTVSHPSAFFSRILPILTFLHDFLPSAGIHHYWFTIRATRPTSDYDTPRWHVDDDFFASLRSIDKNLRQSRKIPKEEGHARWKLCTTLLGPPTLFLPSPSALPTLLLIKAQQQRSHPHCCTSVRCLGCASAGESIRLLLASAFSHEDIQSPASSEIAFFRIGDGRGAVHSEPKCDVDRIFVNIVPGTESDLRALMKRWGMGFPRAWCLGIPGGLVESDEFYGNDLGDENCGLGSEMEGGECRDKRAKNDGVNEGVHDGEIVSTMSMRTRRL